MREGGEAAVFVRACVRACVCASKKEDEETRGGTVLAAVHFDFLLSFFSFFFPLCAFLVCSSAVVVAYGSSLFSEPRMYTEELTFVSLFSFLFSFFFSPFFPPFFFFF
eukprot:TRINITY_DN1505_c0_g3_i1.p2 TRINITY_DN1505_c0_g3~~TRINITY_DN1505_c0_g3_i1.p2  ORF type:complete len:108 (+),score=0.47 TRINITY_DN1505_c0_g3_i1:296-619(+)